MIELNIIPEFGNVVFSSEIVKKGRTMMLYKLKYPEYLNNSTEEQEIYDENFEDFKDRMTKVIQKRCKNHELLLENIKFVKFLHPHPTFFSSINKSYRKFKEFYREKTITELIDEFGDKYEEKINKNCYYKPIKYQGICLNIELSMKDKKR
jgi:hypothetical protein